MSEDRATDNWATPEQTAELRGETLAWQLMLHADFATADAQLSNLATYPHGRLRRETLDTVAEHPRRAEKLLRALDDALDPTQSDAGRDLSTRHPQQRVQRERHALAEAR